MQQKLTQHCKSTVPQLKNMSIKKKIWVYSIDLMYSIVTTGNNTVLHTWNLVKTVNLKSSYHKIDKKVTV